MNSPIGTSYQKKRYTPDELLKHMKEFELDLKTSVGIWYFSPSGGRFHDRYVPKLNIGECIEVAAEMAKYGVKGIEAHYPTEANEENLYLYRQLEKETGIKLLSTGPWIFFDKTFEFGAL